MAETSSNDKRPSTQLSLTGGMVKDLLDSYLKQGVYTHAVNAVNNLADGQVGALSTEMSNLLCVSLPYTMISAIYLADDEWAVFLTDDIHSEIGIFHENNCTYEILTGNQPCLNFNRKSIITGVARATFDCGTSIYWADGQRNPDRYLNTAKIPWIQNCVTTSLCVTCTDTTVLDCEKLRIAPHFKVPCLTLAKSQSSGTLLNGSYQVAIAYTINEIKCTDYIALSNVQSIWAHTNLAGAVVLQLSNLETNIFDEMEVVIVSMINSQVQAKRLGIYSTRQTTIYIDNIDPQLPPIDIALLPLSTPAIEKSNSITSISNYLIRVGSSTKPDINYQPLANNIRAFWTCHEYPDDYYHKGGLNGFPMNVGYMRDEVYAYFIRGVYMSGDKTASYHIPCTAGTASYIIGAPNLGDGSTPVAHGLFYPYISTEKYPDNQPTVWGTLCGQFIRHHKFPDQASFGSGSAAPLSHYTQNNTIKVMGVFFDNIKPFVDNNGNVIQDIQGYEILRATRDGHASVLAKGMINNMRTYTDSSGEQGVFQNYPYNDLRPDPYLTDTVTDIDRGEIGNGAEPSHYLTGYRKDMFSFHSPETVFQQPYLGPGQLKVVLGMIGQSHGQFRVPYKHPEFKVLTDFDSILTAVVGVLSVISNIMNVISGSGYNLTFAATDDLPMTSNMGLTTSVEGPFGTLSAATTTAMLAVTAISTFAMAPIQLKIIQQQMLNVIKGLIPPVQYASQYNSSAFYNTPVFHPYINDVQNISDYAYIKGQMQSFKGQTVNNLYRNNYVLIHLTGQIDDTFSLFNDYSRYTLGDIGYDFNWLGFKPGQYGQVASYYAAYKVPQAAQYGQIDSCRQIPISCCIPITPTAGTLYTSPVLFGGDTYINRYTEKNPFFFFNDWLQDAPVDFAYDYRNYINVPYPMFWMDNTNVYYDFLSIAHRARRLDTSSVNIKLFYVAGGYFYLFCNGVRDFYVESTVNVGYRDYEDDIPRMFYDPYGFTDVNQMFRSDIIKSDIFYKYDYSLSANVFYNNYLSWGQTLRRDYDPILAYTCFSYYPRRVYYSLPQEEEQKRDNWRLFLANNYYDFPSEVTTIKDMGKSGALILMNSVSPMALAGTESIPSNSGTEYTVGTGKLFDQALQSIGNIDDTYQYASCQNKLAVINSPHGLYWVSQVTGKVFSFKGQLEVISDNGLKYWMAKYLPSQLLKQYPDFTEDDNTIVGIGCQLIYDDVTEILYICKKDYKAKSNLKYTPGVGFTICPVGYNYVGLDSSDNPICLLPPPGSDWTPTGPGAGYILLDDTNYFENCSWTISYDCKTKQFISYHSWIPELSLPAKQHFLTSKLDKLWRHNVNTGSYSNFYGIDYPFQIELPIATGNNVVTIESIEYFLEAYNYKSNQVNKFNQFDNGFDRYLVYNAEQSTLWTKLSLKPWNDPYAALGYPFIDGLGNNNVLYSKVENKYRFSNILDNTKDRAEFNFSMIELIKWDNNGYTWTLNPLYLDANKNVFERKKIRHYRSRIFLQKTVVGNNSISLNWLSIQQLNSPR